MNIPGTESVRFRRPTTGPNAVKSGEPEKDQFGSLAPQGWKRRHQGLLQDQLGRCVERVSALTAGNSVARGCRRSLWLCV